MRLTSASLIVPFALAVAACGGAETVSGDEPRPVKIVRVGEAVTPGTGVVVGVVRAGQRAVLSFPVAGRIDRLPVEVGDVVRRGQLVAALDAAPFDLRAKQAEAETGRARAVLTEAQGRLNRQQTLADGGWVAPAAVEAVRAEVDAARGGVEASRAGAALAQRDAGLSRLTAPFSGRIAKRSVDTYAEVQPGTAIVEIDGDGLEAVAPVPSDWTRSLRPGSAVAIQVGERTLAGTVKEISPRAGEAGAVEAIIALAPGSPVRPGDAVRVVLPYPPERVGGLVVPFGAVLMSDRPGQGRVFVVADGRAQPRPVRFARIEGNRAEITSGLRAGEEIVSAGARFLTPGQQVKPTAGRTL